MHSKHDDLRTSSTAPNRRAHGWALALLASLALTFGCADLEGPMDSDEVETGGEAGFDDEVGDGIGLIDVPPSDLEMKTWKCRYRNVSTGKWVSEEFEEEAEERPEDRYYWRGSFYELYCAEEV